MPTSRTGTLLQSARLPRYPGAVVFRHPLSVEVLAAIAAALRSGWAYGDEAESFVLLPPLARALGRPHDSSQAFPVRELLHVEDVDQFLATARTLAAGARWVRHVRVRDGEDIFRVVELRGRALRRANAIVPVLLGTHRSPSETETEREARIARDEERAGVLRWLLIVNREAVVIDALSSAEYPCVGEPEEAIGRRFYDCLPADALEASAASLARALQTGRRQRTRWAQSLGGQILTIENEFVRVDDDVCLVLARDVTDRGGRRTSESAPLEQITAQIPGVIVRCLREADGRFSFSFVSKSAGPVLGVDSETIARNPSLAFRAVLREDRKALRAAIERSTRELASLEQEFRIKLGGSTRWLRLFAKPEGPNPDGSVTLSGVFHDVTDSKDAEAERREAEQRAFRTQKLDSLGLLAGGIAHGYNNMLTGLLANIDLLRRMPSTAGRGGSVADELEQVTLRMVEFTRQILAYSGRKSRPAERCDVNALVSETVRAARTALAPTVRVELALARETPHVRGEPNALKQVMMNLLSNASDAIGDRDGTVRVSTALLRAETSDFGETPWAGSLSPGPFVQIEVEDTGAGMDAATKLRIFDPFFTTKRKGGGLGLSAVLGVLRSHGGAYHVESTPDVGTRFRVFLPIAHPEV